jgi:uncharacterized membrane protein YqjE
MVRQTTIGNGASSSINGVIEGIGDLGTNIVNLATLQARLAAFDLREMTERVVPAAICVGILLPVAFASFTCLFFALAYWISSTFGLTLLASLAIVGLLGLLTATALAIFAFQRFSASLTSFRRSREELDRNVAWLGTVLKQSGR